MKVDADAGLIVSGNAAINCSKRFYDIGGPLASLTQNIASASPLAAEELYSFGQDAGQAVVTPTSLWQGSVLDYLEAVSGIAQVAPFYPPMPRDRVGLFPDAFRLFNECQALVSPCVTGAACVSLPSAPALCLCPQGKHGDGRLLGSGCQ